MLYYCQSKREKKVGMGLMLDMYALLLSKQEREKGRNGFDAGYVCSTTVKTRERKR